MTEERKGTVLILAEFLCENNRFCRPLIYIWRAPVRRAAGNCEKRTFSVFSCFLATQVQIFCSVIAKLLSLLSCSSAEFKRAPGPKTRLLRFGCPGFARPRLREEPNDSTESTIKILRLSPQNDITTQSAGGRGFTPLDRRSLE